MALLDALDKLVIPCDGTDGSQTFIDISDSNHTVTAGGNAQIDTAIKKMGSGSALFDGNGDVLTVSSHADFALGNSGNDAAIAFWFYATGASDERDYIFAIGGGAQIGITLGSGTASDWGTGGNNIGIHLRYSGGWGAQAAGSTNVCDSVWHWIEINKEGDIFKVYVDGVFEVSATYAYTYAQADISIAGSAGDRFIVGQLDDIVLRNGAALHTGDFTPPTLPYGSILLFSREVMLVQGFDIRNRSIFDLDQGYSYNKQNARELVLEQGFDIRNRSETDLLQGHDIRAQAQTDFSQQFHIRVARQLGLDQQYQIRSKAIADLAQGYDVWTRSGYRVVAYNINSEIETELGFIDAGNDLTLQFSTLASGEYEIRIYLWGYIWQDWLLALTYYVKMTSVGSPGEATITPLAPPILKWLDTEQIFGRSTIRWEWIGQAGVLPPNEFYLWISETTPVDTSGDPTDTELSFGAGNYSYVVEHTAVRYVALSAVQGTTIGEAITQTIPYPWATVDSPAVQFAHDEDLGLL